MKSTPLITSGSSVLRLPHARGGVSSKPGSNLNWYKGGSFTPVLTLSDSLHSWQLRKIRAGVSNDCCYRHIEIISILWLYDNEAPHSQCLPHRASRTRSPAATCACDRQRRECTDSFGNLAISGDAPQVVLDEAVEWVAQHKDELM